MKFTLLPFVEFFRRMNTVRQAFAVHQFCGRLIFIKAIAYCLLIHRPFFPSCLRPADFS